MKRFLASVLFVCTLARCAVPPLEGTAVSREEQSNTVLSGAVGETAGEEEPPAPSSGQADADSGLTQILSMDSTEGSAQFLLYLLEHFEEVKGLADRFRHILLVYERDGLHEAQIEVLQSRPVDTETLLGVPGISNRYGYALSFYEMDVLVKAGGERKRLEEGEHKWLAAFIEDDYQYIDFVLPYDAALERLQADLQFPDEVTRVRNDSLLLRGSAFSTPEEIPVDTLLFYLMWMGEGSDPDEGDYDGAVMTQEQLDAAAKKFLGIDHFDATETEYYLEDKGLYHRWLGGFEGPVVGDVLRAEKSGESTVLYFDQSGMITDYLLSADFERTVRRYTYTDGYLASVEELDAAGFAPVILAGENG